jgi:hypothetical protein
MLGLEKSSTWCTVTVLLKYDVFVSLTVFSLNEALIVPCSVLISQIRSKIQLINEIGFCR